MRRLLLLSVPLLAHSCGSDPSPAPKNPAPPTTAVATNAPPAARQAPPPRPLPSFQNPGGMWMPHQVSAHAAKLKELGLAVDPAALADPTSGVLSAVVSLGGCSASFVSPEGLI